MTVYTLTKPAGWGNLKAIITDQSGGAIQRLAWENITGLGGITREFINNADHGRLLQASVSTTPADSEVYNPTEAGSLYDGSIMQPSTSRLLSAKQTADNVIETVTQMAFWKPVNGRKVSNFILKKRFTLGYQQWNGIEVYEELITPDNESFSVLQFEGITAYLPSAFSVFETFDKATCNTAPVSDGPGEQPLPLVFSTPPGVGPARFAFGIFSPAGNPGGGYGRWRWGDCTKWNAVSRVTSPVPGAVHSRRYLMALGQYADFKATMPQLF